MFVRINKPSVAHPGRRKLQRFAALLSIYGARPLEVFSPMSTAVKTRNTRGRSRRSAGGSRTCDGCEVTVRWMDGVEHDALPPNWVSGKRGTFCLLCRRTNAAEEALEAAPEGTSREDLAKLRSTAMIEFEIKRDPDRADGEIAKGVRTSVAAVGRARKRLAA